VAETIEILFDENTGDFVVHFENVETHDKEHEIISRLATKLRAAGFEVDTDQYHDKPKIPEVNEENILQRLKILK